METNCTPEINRTPVPELRQDDVVAIPVERYEELIEEETRLSLLRKMRYVDVAFEKCSYIRPEDYILGGEALDLLIAGREKALQQEAAHE